MRKTQVFDLKSIPGLPARIRVHDLSIFVLQGHLIEVVKMKDDLLERSHCGISPSTSHPSLPSFCIPSFSLSFSPLSLSPLRTFYPAKTVPSTPPSLLQPSEVEGGIIEKVLTLGVEQKQIRAEVGSCRTTNIQDGRVWSGERQGKREGICPEKTGVRK